MASQDGGAVLPSRTKSKRTPSSLSKDGHRERLQKSAASSSPPKTTPRAARPSLATRTASAPLVSTIRDPKLEIVGFEPDGHNQRVSITSIKDDPFFRNYQSPHTVSLARELRSATYHESLRDELAADDSVENKPTMDDSVNLPPQSRSGMADINIAVIGSAGVGKSTLIQRAFGLSTPPTSIASSLRMSVDNIVYTVSLIKLDLESFDIPADHRMQWPKQINGHIVPRMDGALLLYDVMNRESIAELPQTLNGLVSSLLPTILVSCKCDNPEITRQIDVDSMKSAFESSVKVYKAAWNVPESARTCLSAMLRAIMETRNANNTAEPPGTRRRATSSATIEKPPTTISRPLSQHSKHGRASSDYSLLRGFPSPPLGSARGQTALPKANNQTNLRQQFALPDPHEAPPLSSHPAFRSDSSQRPNDIASQLTQRETKRSPLPTPGKAAENSFLDMEESDADSSYRYSDEIPILQRNDESYFDKPAKVAGVSFDELVDRLLSQHMTRADQNFSDIFLCLYRKFAAPGELFNAIQLRLDRISADRNMHYLTRVATQLRIVTVVAKWVSCYPGDFASASTSTKLEEFVTNLASDPVFAVAAQDMRTQLQSRVVEDDDTGWARTDADVETEVNSSAESGPSSPARTKTTSKSELEDGMLKLEVDTELNNLERQQSTGDSASSGRPQSPTQSLAPSYHTVEDYERAAVLMIPKGTLPLTKFRYHIFMDTSYEDFADEMTRIDWVMFSSIRLRDLVRHVSLSLNQKEKCKSLANVNRMISHFNHVAKWVANMILLRDKAKHRAQILEKFMNIALRLRQLKNYNGLAAVLAGINGTAIHRLAQTRALVPPEIHKKFATLVVLMGSQKSHFAYRLAWENSTLPRIPFIPLHRRDLVSAEEGSRTFVGAKGERINWKKFEILSEVILPIMKSQVVPYPNLARQDGARDLILDCRMPGDEEDLYQRSVQLESSSGTLEAGKKKFPWFQKEK